MPAAVAPPPLLQTFDNEGRFVPEKFEEIFSKYDREGKGGLSWRDIQEMVRGRGRGFRVRGIGCEDC